MDEKELDRLQRLLDYHLRLDGAAERLETERLLAEDDGFAGLSRAVERTVEPLGAWRDDEAPAGLAERTVQFVEQREKFAAASRAIAEQRRTVLVESEQGGGRGRWILGNLRELIAVAACIAITLIAWQPGVRRARQKSQQIACAAQLGRTGVALGQYAHDNDGFLPYVQQRPGGVWWRVEGDDANSASNTRNLYMLVRRGYRPAEAFVCPARDRRVRVRMRPETLEAMQDFASRDDVNYSFRLIVDDDLLYFKKGSVRPLLADQNPLFDPGHFDSSRQTEVNLAEDARLLRSNSPNHGGEGQNVLYSDGLVDFLTGRTMGPGQDDIFTIKSTTLYRGTERPQSADDIFIAP